MSEPQTDYDTEDGSETAGQYDFPTAPWDYSRIEAESEIHDASLYEAAVWDNIGDLVAVTTTQMAGNGEIEHAYDRARLIAAAGTVAQEAKEMGYDPFVVLEALPELLGMMENAAIDLTDLRAFVAENELHNIRMTRSARRVLQKALAKAGADETMIPGEDDEVEDALKRAEGRDDA